MTADDCIDIRRPVNRVKQWIDLRPGEPEDRVYTVGYGGTKHRFAAGHVFNF